MNAVRCPKCKFHESLYSAPLGKIVRNPYASLTNAVHDNCNACDGTGYVPTAVVDAIVRFSSTIDLANARLNELRWNRDHFTFTAYGMYVGVETDGYLHT